MDRRTCEPEAAAPKDGTKSYREPWLKGDNLYASDSYVAVRIPVKRDQHDTDGYVPRAALAAARKSRDFPHVLVENGEAVTITKDGTLRVPRGELGQFEAWPEVDALFPPEPFAEGRMSISFNVDKLLQVAKALGTANVTVTFDPNTDSGPLFVVPLNSDGTSRAGLVMPVRRSSGATRG